MFEQRRRLRILIADDAAGVRRDLRRLLELAGDFEVVGEAEDGESAVAQSELLHPDVVVTDLAMPGRMDGFAAGARIKAALGSCRLVALTIHSDPASRAKAGAAGFDAYVLKGAPLTELLGAICSLGHETPSLEGGRS